MGASNCVPGIKAAPTAPMRVILIHNRDSGDDEHVGEDLVALLSEAGHQVTYASFKGRWRSALDDPLDLAVVAGGDGTVSKVARAVAGRALPLTILPMGTANNIAEWLGLTGIPRKELVAGWPRAILQSFDLGVAQGPWGTYRFLESLGVGLLAGMMSEIDAGGSAYVNELEGRERRITAALEVLDRVLKDFKPVTCAIQLDDIRCSGDYLMVEVMNFGAAGPNLRLAPRAHGADGVLDVVLVEAHERAWLADHFKAMRADSPPVSTLRVHHAREVTIRCDRCMMHIDDELWNGDPELSSVVAQAHVEAAALTFFVPPVTHRGIPPD